MRKKIFGNLHFLLFFCFFWCGDAFFTPYLSLYLEIRGLSATRIGLVNASFFLIVIAAAFFAGFLADKTKRPRGIILLFTLLTCGALWCVSRSAAFLSLVFSCGLYAFFSSPCNDLADKLLMDRIRHFPRLYGLFRMGGPIGYSIGVLAAGFVIARKGIFFVFMPGMIFFLLCNAMGLLMPNPSVSPLADSFSSKRKVPLRLVFTNPHAAYVYSAMAMWGFSEVGALSYVALFLSDKGFGTDYISLLISVAMGGQTLAYLTMPIISRGLRYAQSLFIGFFLLSLRILSLTLVNILPLTVTLGLQCLGGMSQAFVYPAITQIIAADFDKEVSNIAQTLKTMANRGIGSCTGVFLYGVLYDHWPANRVMILYGIFALSYGLILLIWKKLIPMRKEEIT
jgi:MFS family permease